MRAHPQVAIDGPAGVGKSTIGEGLAHRLHCAYVDTGALYRTLTVIALRRHIASDAVDELTDLARALNFRILPPGNVPGRQYTVMVDGEDITPMLRTPDVEREVPVVSSHDSVRHALIERMRRLASEQGVVMVGRDIGTVVLPDADVKIFLTTSIEERARRRHRDLVARLGNDAPALDDVRREIVRRDAIDASHTVIAPDATIINNDHLEAEDVIAQIAEIVAQRQAGSR